MDIIDLFWNLSQDEALDDLKTSHVKAIGKDAVLIQRLQRDNRELRLRVSVLIRLLIERGVITADQYSSLLRDTKSNLESNTSSRSGQS